MDRAVAAKQKSARRAAFGCIPTMNAGADPRHQRGGGPCNCPAAGFLCIDPTEEFGVPEAAAARLPGAGCAQHCPAARSAMKMKRRRSSCSQDKQALKTEILEPASAAEQMRSGLYDSRLLEEKRLGRGDEVINLFALRQRGTARVEQLHFVLEGRAFPPRGCRPRSHRQKARAMPPALRQTRPRCCFADRHRPCSAIVFIRHHFISVDTKPRTAPAARNSNAMQNPVWITITIPCRHRGIDRSAASSAPG
jgi:hypothetical protein